MTRSFLFLLACAMVAPAALGIVDAWWYVMTKSTLIFDWDPTRALVAAGLFVAARFVIEVIDKDPAQP